MVLVYSREYMSDTIFSKNLSLDQPEGHVVLQDICHKSVFLPRRGYGNLYF
jgi:hypothetical protein